MDSVTTAVAGAAVASPLWMKALDATHDIVAWSLPFMGFAWLALQMYFKIRNETRNRKR